MIRRALSALAEAGPGLAIVALAALLIVVSIT
jgi:hypothetical protein